jgi:hypothetical protein
MFSYKHLPEQLAEISGTWGIPWHGKLVGGSVMHGSTVVKTGYPQPAGEQGVSGVLVGGTRSRDHAGYTFYQKSPFVSEVVRTPEQVLEDTATKKRWDNDFIVRGTRALFPGSSAGTGIAAIHNKQTDGWIYFAPDGSRWLVPLLTQIWWGTEPSVGNPAVPIPLELNFTLSRFGELGGEAESHAVSITKTLAEMGQTSPSITFGTADYLFAQVEDITKAGNKAIIALWLTLNGLKNSLGFLELSMTGTPGVDFSAAVTVLKSRSEVLGTYTFTDYTDLGETGSIEYNLVVTEPIPAPTIPDCSGTQIWQKTAYKGVLSSPRTGWEITGQMKGVFDGRIVAMVYDSSDVAQPVTLKIEQVNEYDYPAFTFSGGSAESRIDYRNAGDVCTTVGSTFYGIGEGSWTKVKTFSVVGSVTMTLTYLGRTLTRRVEGNYSATTTRVGVFVAHISGALAPEITNETYSVDVDGTTVTASNTIDTTPFNPVIEFRPVGDNLTAISPTHSARSIVLQTSPDTTISVSPMVGNQSVMLCWRRWSNNMFGLSTHKSTATIVSDTNVSQTATYAAIHKTGTVSDFTYVGHRFNVYGSYNPKTGEVAIPSDGRVSWV